MSLIQEALKRQQMEQEKAKGGKADAPQGSPVPPMPPAPPPPQPPAPALRPSLSAVKEETPPQAQPKPVDIPSAPPPPPPAPRAEPPAAAETKPAETKPAADKKAPKIVLVILLVVVLIGVAGWLIWYGISMLGKSDKKEPIPPPPPPVPVKVVTPDVPTSPPPAIVTNDIPQPPVAITPIAPPDVPVNTIPENTGTVAAVTPPPPPPPPPPPVVTQETVGVQKPPVKWPLIGLKGIVGSGRNGSAIIVPQSGKSSIVSVGEAVDGVTLVRIDKGSIVLEYEGERKTLRTGDKTE